MDKKEDSISLKTKIRKKIIALWGSLFFALFIISITYLFNLFTQEWRARIGIIGIIFIILSMVGLLSLLILERKKIYTSMIDFYKRKTVKLKHYLEFHVNFEAKDGLYVDDEKGDQRHEKLFKAFEKLGFLSIEWDSIVRNINYNTNQKNDELISENFVSFNFPLNVSKVLYKQIINKTKLPYNFTITSNSFPDAKVGKMNKFSKIKTNNIRKVFLAIGTDGNAENKPQLKKFTITIIFLAKIKNLYENFSNLIEISRIIKEELNTQDQTLIVKNNKAKKSTSLHNLTDYAMIFRKNRSKKEGSKEKNKLIKSKISKKGNDGIKVEVSTETIKLRFTTFPSEEEQNFWKEGHNSILTEMSNCISKYY